MFTWIAGLLVDTEWVGDSCLGGPEASYPFVRSVRGRPLLVTGRSEPTQVAREEEVGPARQVEGECANPVGGDQLPPAGRAGD